MRILLDENMPRKLLSALQAEGHEVESVKSLQLAGIDNGALYELAASTYDLCFTRDAEFSRRVLSKPAARLKLVRVVIPQTRQDEFVQQFLIAFRTTDWSSHKSATIGPHNVRDSESRKSQAWPRFDVPIPPTLNIKQQSGLWRVFARQRTLGQPFDSAILRFSPSEQIIAKIQISMLSSAYGNDLGKPGI